MENAADPSAMHADHSGHQMDASKHHEGHPMVMYFHSSLEAKILFKGWETETVAQLVGSCVVVLVLGVIFEAVKYFRSHLLQGEQLARHSETVEVEGPDGKIRIVSRSSYIEKICQKGHTVQTLLHVLQFVIGYSLMLVFMTYNVWLCLAVTMGIGVGYFLFGWERVPVPLVGDVQKGDCCH